MPNALVYRQIVRFPDVDHAGIAYFATLLSYCHHAHEDWLERIGYPLQNLLDDHGMGFPIVHVEADFNGPARHGDRLEVVVGLRELRDKVLALNYEIGNVTTGTAVGRVRIVQVCTDMSNMTSTAIPPHFRRAVTLWNAESPANPQ